MHIVKLACFMLVGFSQPLMVAPRNQYAAIFSKNQPKPFSHLRSPVVGKHLLNSITISDFQVILARTVREVLEGPLKGKTISLLLDYETEKRIHTDYLLANINTPVSLLRITKDYETSNPDQMSDQIDCTNYNLHANESSNSILRHMDCINESDSFLEEVNNNHQLYSAGDVLVYVIGEQDMTPYMNFSSSWSLAALLLVSIYENCDIDYLLQTPLATQTSSVTLLCPVFLRQRFDGFRALIFRVYSWLPFHPKQKLLTLGEWSPFSFLTWEDLFVDRFVSFYGSTLHVSSDIGDHPFLFMNPEGEYDGICKRIMDVFGNWMNFSYSLVLHPQDFRWGTFENETWVGMLGEVWREEKDLTINAISITEERSKDFEFSVPYYRAGFGFSILEPPPLPRWLNLTFPFTWEVWVGTTAAVLVMAVVFYLLNYRRNKLSFVDAFLIITQSMMNQSITWVPKSWLFRLFLAIWWFSAYVIVVSYTCNLIAILSIPNYPIKLQTVDQLAKSDYRLCMVDYGEFVPVALATSSDANLFALGSKLDLVPMTEIEWYGEEVCVDLVLKTQYAHLEFLPYLQKIYKSLGHSGSVYYLKEKIYEANLAFFFRKNTPWKYKFDKGIQQLMESNLIEKWLADIRHDGKQRSSKGSTESTDKRLSLSHLGGPFFILALGEVFASLLFIIEILGDQCKCW